MNYEELAQMLEHEARFMKEMSDRMGLPWTVERQAKVNGYRESANLVRNAGKS